MIGAVAGRPVPMPVQTILAWQQSIERVQHVVIGAGPDLDHDQPGRRMRHEDRKKAVLRVDVADERAAGRGQVGQPPRRARPDRELAGLYGKMLRSASRMRPRPPIAGADS